EDLLDVLGGRALSIRILDPQHEGTPGAACQQPVVESSPSTADVQRAGGRRSKAKPHEASMLIGAHVSPAGGLPKAVERGVERGCRAIQIFNQSPRMWKPAAHSPESIEAFREAMAASEIDAVLIHAVYLVNCASEDPEIRAKSVASLTHSLRIGEQIGACAVVLHPGSAK